MKTSRRGRKPKIRERPVVDLLDQDADTTCKFCQAEFLDPDDLKVHNAQMHPFSSDKRLTCHFCLCDFSGIDDFLLHIRDQHIPYMKSCMYCVRAFTDTLELKNHEEKHIVDKRDMYSCAHCKVLFGNLRALENHEATSHSENADGIMLQKYYPHLTTILGMKADTFMRSLGNDSVYSCMKCKIKTHNIKVYIQHLQDRKCISYACDRCAAIFSLKLHLNRHFRYHPECHQSYDRSKVKEKCWECKKTFSIDVYRLHIKKCKAVKCSSCDIKFTTVDELSKHQSSEHPLFVTLKTCRYCQQQLVGSVALAKHMERIHGNDYHLYKYHCYDCKRIFKHPKDLFGHFFAYHKNFDPYSCKLCNLKFRLRKKFTIHIKLVHDSKGFVEFEKDFTVYFTDKQSENKFQPSENPSLYNDEEALSLPHANEFRDARNKKHVKKQNIKNKVSNMTQKQSVKEITLSDMNTDLVSEADSNVIKSLRRKSTCKRKINSKRNSAGSTDISEISNLSDEDEPLLNVSKRSKAKRLKMKDILDATKKGSQNIKRRLTCNICKKYCYTIQNYHRHITLHFRSESKECVKCAKLFESKEKLDLHIKSEHSTSQITETLKKFLGKRKFEGPPNLDINSTSQKFERTIKKVKIPICDSSARIVPATKKIQSVKNFLESFTPDVNDAKMPSVIVNNVVKITPLNTPIQRKEVIKMFQLPWVDVNLDDTCKLKMPVSFNKSSSDTVKANISVYQGDGKIKRAQLNYGTEIVPEEVNDNYADNNIESYDTFDDYGQTHVDHEYILPDVSHEVMLENTEDPTQRIQISIPHEIVLPNLENTKNKHKIHIAHLQPQAPFYKIVSFENMMNPKKEKQETEETIKEEEITLPSGTKLVHTNPLAHLLGDKSVEDLLVNKSTYYKPKLNQRAALAKALKDLHNPPKKREKKSRKK